MDMLPYKIIGNHLRTARKQLNLTQEAVANRAYVSRNHYGRIERGEARPSIDSLITICAALHLSVQEVVRGISPTEGDVTNHVFPDEDFTRFFASMNERASKQMKVYMIRMCRMAEENFEYKE